MPSPSSAFMAQGTQLQRETTPGGGIFATISEVRDIKGPNETTAIQEVTNHDSANFLREWINGLIDPGSLDFTANYLPKDGTQDAATGFYYAFHQRQRDNYKVVVAASMGTFSLIGLPVKHEKTFPADGKPAEFSGSIKITGLLTYAA